MPAAVPLVAAVAGYGASAAIGGGLLGALGGFVVSSAINQIGGRALTKKPKNQSTAQDASGRTLVIRSSVESHKIIYGTTRVSGPLVYVSTANDGAGPASPPKDNKMLYMVIPLAGHEVEDITTVYFNDQPVTFDTGATEGYVFSAPYYLNGASYAFVSKHLGSIDQTADPMLVAEASGWTTAHRLRGIAYLAIRLEYSADVYPLGIPNISAVVKGKKVYDPRTLTTAWSANAALCIRDYMTSEYGFNCDDDEISDSYFIAAANVCDEDVTLAAGGTQDRYTCNGVVDTASAPLDNLGSLVSSLAGAVTYVQGTFRLHAGAYDSPSGTITMDMLSGPVSAELRTARKELFNAVKGTYVDPSKSWQPTDFPFVTNSTYETQDNGERIYTDIDLPFTQSSEAAQRIAKIILEKGRQGIKVELPLNHTAMKYAVFDVINVTNDAFGWSAKPFRIIKVTTTGTGPMTLSLQEESSASYDWSSGEESTLDAAPDTNLPDPLNVAAPGAPTVTESLYTTTDGSGVKTKALVSWGASSDAFVREYQVEYKLTTDTEYTIGARTTATALEVLDITPGSYNVRVKAISSLGVSSEYSPVTTQSIYGLTAAPASVSNLSLNVIGNAAHLSWDQATDLDVLNGGWVRFRYSPSLSGAAWNAAVDIGPSLSGISTSAVLPLLAGTYLAKFVDSTGNASANESTVTTNVVSLLELNVVTTINEHPTFAGTKTDVAFDETLGGIKLSGAVNWDDYPGNIDTWPMIDGLGGVASSGTYDFANSVDLGAVYTSKLTAAIAASGYDTGDLFDSRLGNIDSWTSFDGGGISDFTSGYWTTVTNVSVTADATAAPDGTMNADMLTENTVVGAAHLIIGGDDLGIAGAKNVTTEIYAKSGNRNLRIEMSWAGELVRVNFDLTNGVVDSTSTPGATTLVDYGITPAPNGFYRLWVTGMSDNWFDEFSYVAFNLLDGGFGKFYTGDGTSGVYLWSYKTYPGTLQAVSANDDTNAAIYLRTTDDDPAGSPVWSDWRQFFVGDYTARAFEFQLRMTSANTNHNILVTELGVTVDMPDRVESQYGIISGAGSYAVTYANAFRTTPSLNVNAYDLGTGDYYAITSESETGFTVTFKNSGGTSVSRKFDYQAKGYGKLIT
ncbi:MAG: hypothetical protein K8U57_30505 [Planctomycetes bacterium]|nr:hypothetical protein [Planctomycetota bacterium]